MELRILDRGRAQYIDADAWDGLAARSVRPNPFYERWSLLPALRYLEPRNAIFVVTAYSAGELVALFPVTVERRNVLLRYAQLWEFHTCLRSDALIAPDICLGDLFRETMKRLKVHVLVCPSHAAEGVEFCDDPDVFQKKRSRKAVTRFDGWDAYLERMPRKYRKENKRIVARLMDRRGAVFVVDRVDIANKWFPLYLELEERSWRGIGARTISAHPERMHYFADVMEYGGREAKIEYQTLFLRDVAIAMSFRYLSGSSAFDIKTAYREDCRKLYPGVVLELMTMRHTLNSGLSFVDSCAPKNKVVERIWPDEIELTRSVLFDHSAGGRLTQAAYRRYQEASDRRGAIASALRWSIANRNPPFVTSREGPGNSGENAGEGEV